MAKEETVNVSDERNKALKLAIEKIEKDFGKGAIMKLGDKPSVSVETIPTGALALDVALGVGGIPRGRITMFAGKESSGKSTTALDSVKNAQIVFRKEWEDEMNECTAFIQENESKRSYKSQVDEKKQRLAYLQKRGPLNIVYFESSSFSPSVSKFQISSALYKESSVISWYVLNTFA